MDQEKTTNFLFGSITGFLLFYWSTRLCDGTVPIGKTQLGSIIITIGEICIHIHHWMILLVILLFTKNVYVQGFCVGGIIQGLTFPDWYQIVYHNKESKEKNNSKIKKDLQ
jgi:hypothetical protein